MKFKIDIIESVKIVNTVTIDVCNEEDGHRLMEMIEDDIAHAENYEDITNAIEKAGYEIEGTYQDSVDSRVGVTY